MLRSEKQERLFSRCETESSGMVQAPLSLSGRAAAPLIRHTLASDAIIHNENELVLVIAVDDFNIDTSLRHKA